LAHLLGFQEVADVDVPLCPAAERIDEMAEKGESLGKGRVSWETRWSS
jgi:hypothetical protein